MWRATILTVGAAVALGGLSNTGLAAQATAGGRGGARTGQAVAQGADRANQRPGSKPGDRRDDRGIAYRDDRSAVTRDDRGPQGRTIGRDRSGPGTTYGRDGAFFDPRFGSSVRYYQDSRYRGQAPAFCRSGAGHPTLGRQWCYDKGYGLGGQRWSRAAWSGVAFLRPARYSGWIGGAALRGVLGNLIYLRLYGLSLTYGWGTLNGHWLDASVGPRILEIRAGGRPLAELYDRDRDGRVDLVMLNHPR